MKRVTLQLGGKNFLLNKSNDIRSDKVLYQNNKSSEHFYFFLNPSEFFKKAFKPSE